MRQLGGGLFSAQQYEDAFPIQQAELSTLRRLDAPECDMLVTQTNLASTYHFIGRPEEALSMRQEVYSGNLKLNGEEHQSTLIAANNYATSFLSLHRFEEAKALLRKTIPVAQRILGESHNLTFSLRSIYADALHQDADATLDDLRESVTTLEELERTARRVLGDAHPLTGRIELHLREEARAALAAREGVESIRDAVGALNT